MCLWPGHSSQYKYTMQVVIHVQCVKQVTDTERKLAALAVKTFYLLLVLVQCSVYRHNRQLQLCSCDQFHVTLQRKGRLISLKTYFSCIIVCVGVVSAPGSAPPAYLSAISSSPQQHISHAQLPLVTRSLLQLSGSSRISLHACLPACCLPALASCLPANQCFVGYCCCLAILHSCSTITSHPVSSAHLQLP